MKKLVLRAAIWSKPRASLLAVVVGLSGTLIVSSSAGWARTLGSATGLLAFALLATPIAVTAALAVRRGGARSDA